MWEDIRFTTQPPGDVYCDCSERTQRREKVERERERKRERWGSGGCKEEPLQVSHVRLLDIACLGLWRIMIDQRGPFHRPVPALKMYKLCSNHSILVITMKYLATGSRRTVLMVLYVPTRVMGHSACKPHINTQAHSHIHIHTHTHTHTCS